ncbi:REP element-mobilizing transposase RayT [Niabella hirudinis]
MDNERVISFDDHGCYVLTLETVDLTDIFIRPVYKQIIVHTLNHYISSKGLVVYGWCLMPNKLHLICQVQKNIPFKELRKAFKAFTAEKVMEAVYNEPEERRDWLIDHFQRTFGFLGAQKKLELWKRVKEMLSIDLARPEIMAEHLELIHNIPVQERIVRYASDFIYSSAADYETGTEGLVKITRPSAVEQALDDIANRKSVFKTKFYRR